MNHFSEDGCYAGNSLHKSCPNCGASLLGNQIGDEWCSCVDCSYIRLASDPDVLKTGEIELEPRQEIT